MKFNPAAARAENPWCEVGVMACRRLAIPMLVACLWLGFMSAANAHAIVVESLPAGNALVPPGSLEIAVTFNTRLDRARSRLTLAAPDGAVTTVAVRDDTPPTRLSGHAEVAAAGVWKLRWQVLAADGHITRGEIPFRVRAPAR